MSHPYQKKATATPRSFSSFSTTESSSDTPPHLFTDEDFMPAPKHPEQDPIISPVRSTLPAPTAAPSPPPVLAQPTPVTEQSTPAQASTSKKRYKRTMGTILQPSPSHPKAVDSRSESPSPPKRRPSCLLLSRDLCPRNLPGGISAATADPADRAVYSADPVCPWASTTGSYWFFGGHNERVHRNNEDNIARPCDLHQKSRSPTSEPQFIIEGIGESDKFEGRPKENSTPETVQADQEVSEEASVEEDKDKGSSSKATEVTNENTKATFVHTPSVQKARPHLIFRKD
ncbi:proline-rich receptor-like protein kinase PERK8 [Hibiscus syriacus]|uniref:proline-rich receptor-like protein kinase PERK8 n=1 Tax=Hibiscus syriacus TaxID=106335 RepID=UPI001921B16B|nr:proline-rich receptor-like protein kinase PERK8 [Hibiscus syriacus]